MINFPNSPVGGQQFTVSGRTWEWNATKSRWDIVPVSTADAIAATEAAGNAIAARDIAVQAASDASDYKDIAYGYAQDANGYAYAAEQSAQEAASIVLGEVFDDGVVSPILGWSSDKISNEIALSASIKKVAGKDPDGAGNVDLDVEDITGLEDELGSKADASHSHAIGDVTGLSGALGDKVDKVAGKSLSENDYTTLDKNKLAGIEAGAQVNPTPVDNLESTSTALPLSANQGRVLKFFIDGINSMLLSDDASLDELQEIVDFIKLNRSDLETLGIDSIAGLSDALAGKAASIHGHVVSDIVGLQSALDDKVVKVTGKGLSQNDYTTPEKNKLAGIEAGAQVNVNADWNATSGDAQILNKPGVATTSVSGLMSSSDKGKLDNLGIADIAGLQSTLDEKLDSAALSVSSVDIADSTAVGRSLMTAADAASARTAISADEAKTTVTQSIAEAGVSGTVYNWTPQRVRQAITGYVGSNALGNRTVSTASPSGGSDGDIWLKV